MAALKHIKFLISIVVVSAIDNLLEGAAGQALQNFNIMFGFDGMIGLLNIPFYP